ncbi:MAG: V-type ATP synthase subunit I [Porphyrobacter sp.]|nr:V-type ATP synthase subunit I [Porphyrobacter sp.]
MSIAPLVRVDMVAALADRDRLLAELQTLGVVHLDVLDRTPPEAVDAGFRAACAWLASAPQRRRPAIAPPDFDAAAVTREALALREQRRMLDEERAALTARMREVELWGRWTFRSISEHPQLRLWFFKLPARALTLLDGHIWHEVRRVGGEHWVVIVAAEEPRLPLPRVHIGARSLADLEARLAEVDTAIDDIEAARTSLTRWLPALEQARERLADAVARAAVAANVDLAGPVFALSGWAPAAALRRLQGFAEASGAALLARPPASDEQPPTLLDNPPRWRAGEALVQFFVTPDYRAWDPSALVAASFVFFFAVIVSDALYGLALLVLVLALGRRLRRSEGGGQLRRMGLLLALATLVWGVLVGVYGGAPPPAPWLARWQLIPGGDLDIMLTLSIAIGLVHLALANAIAAWRLWPARPFWGRIGWIVIFLAAGLAFGWPQMRPVAAWLGGAGLLVVLFGSSARSGWGRRLRDGLPQAARLVSALGDTMSYLRLFALALAGSALAAAFNGLARDAWTVPGAGAVLGLLVLVIGHSLNLALSVASGVVHGLRLNYIEFFGWGLWGEGRPFRGFRRCAGEPG